MRQQPTTALLRTLVFAIASLPGSLLLDLAFHDGARALTMHSRHPAATLQLHIVAHGAVLLAALAAALIVSVGSEKRLPALRSVTLAGVLNGLLGPELALVTAAAYGPFLGFLVLLGFALLALGTVVLTSTKRPMP